MAVAVLALFVAMGGSGYAALKLPKGSVGAKQLKANAVKSSKVKNRSLRRVDFKAGELPVGGGGTANAPGVPGVPGAPGVPGTPGAPGRDGAAIVTTYMTTVGRAVTSSSFANVFSTTGDTWTQPANALDYFFGRVRVSFPSSCQDPNEDVHLSMRLYTNGVSATVLQDLVMSPADASRWYTIAFQQPYTWLPPPGADTERRLLALVKTDCATADRPRLEEMRIDVVRAVG